MGGRLSLIVAGALGDKIAAAASFHGGNIGKEDDPNSPHHAADKIKAAVYVGGAIEDQSYPAEQAEALENALTSAGVKHKLETYQAHHGWCVPDHSTYDKPAAEKHWQVLESFYGENLKA
jgi:carboxymethylenebutenolidase